MKVLTIDQIREADKYTIENEPISSIDLMERASGKLFEWISKNNNSACEFIIFAGTGNNGGDALALARIMYNARFQNIQVYCCSIGVQSADYRVNRERLGQMSDIKVSELREDGILPNISANSIVIDGIFGSGLSRPVMGYWGKLIEHINSYSKQIIAIDVPSGLFADSNTDYHGAIIRANTTLTFQFPKKSFFFAENELFVGNWYVLDIGLHTDSINNMETHFDFMEQDDIKKLILPRSKFSHKGTYGHAFLVAGSYQKMGAAVLAAKGVLLSGVGLLTVHVPQLGYNIIQTAVPEAMVCIDETEMNYCNSESLDNYTCVGIGPGIGAKPSVQDALLMLIKNMEKPMVFDADALNILSLNKKWLELIPVNSIFTPHPGEFDRLSKKHNSNESRLASQLKFSIKYKVIVVLKGAFTSITTPEGFCCFNSTGNCGMATAGSGDVLTGIILSLLAQGYKGDNAAKIGVFMHGLAGDIAADKHGVHSLIASDILKNLGKAFIKVSS